MKHRLKLAAALALCAQMSATHAHDVWLLPSSTVLSAAGYVTVDGAVSNDTFHFNYRPLNVGENLVITAPDGNTVEAENQMLGKLRTVFDVNLQQEGTYRVAVVSSGLMAGWKEGGENKRWRGQADDFASNVPTNAEDLRVNESANRIETFITVGKPGSIEPTGKGLELLPVTHPNDLYSGEEATFRFMVDGEPAAGVEIAMMRGGTRYRDQLEKIELVTDAEGRFSVTWKEPGMYWLDADAQDEKTSIPQAKVRRLAYTATFEVLPQ